MFTEDDRVLGCITDAEERDIAVKIIGLLDNLPMSQALHIVESLVPSMLKMGHRVDKGMRQFRYMLYVYGHSDE
jgi:hypothetical protein